MNSALEIDKKIIDLLQADEELTAMVGEGIYPIVVEEHAHFPFVVLNRSAINISYCKDGVSQEIADVKLTVVAKDYITTYKVLQRVRELLEFHTDDYFADIVLTNFNEGWYNNAYVQEMTIKCALNV